MATMVGTQDHIGRAFNALLELELDSIEAYRAAVARFDSQTYIERFRTFLEEHEAHAGALEERISELAVEPASRADLKGTLAKGKVVIGSLLGDRAILLAMKANEEDTNTAYERFVKRMDIPSHLRRLAETFLEEERAHLAFIEAELDARGDRDEPRDEDDGDDAQYSVY